LYPLSLTQSHCPAQTDDAVRESTVGGVLREAAHLWGNETALIEAAANGDTGRAWTYRALLDDAERLALALSTHFAPGERVALWAPNVPEWVLFEFAAGLAGLTLVTVNPGYQPKELQYVLSQSRAAGLFLTREYRGNPMAQIARAAAAALPSLRHIADIEDRAALHATGARKPALPAVAPGDAAQIQYTSGTTGFPKGALLHHRGLTNNARFCQGRLGLRAGETFLNPMPMFHTSGCVVGALGAAQYGARHMLVRQFDPVGMLTLLAEQGVAIGVGVPTMLIAMLEAHAALPRTYEHLRVMLSGGAMVSPDIVRRVQESFGCDFEIVYGQTEISCAATQLRRTDCFADKTETVGQPLPQTEIAVFDVNTGGIAALDAQGEIGVRGYGVMLGYNDNPEATAETIDAEGWLRTGDLGTLDARGYLRITGRVKDMIIRGGENLFPAEIENVMLEHPAIAEASVVGVPDPHWGEVAVCFYRPATGHAPSREDLIVHLRGQLAAQKTPARWIAVDSFPLTGSGKIQKFVLRDRYIAGEFAAD
jgi:fatty-acyl-CoA synthase